MLSGELYLEESSVRVHERCASWVGFVVVKSSVLVTRGSGEEAQTSVQSSVVLDSVNCRILPHFDKIRSNFGQFKESLEEFSAYYASLSYS
ncbi:hypothetical protein YC2023_083687 [Brassica napus]